MSWPLTALTTYVANSAPAVSASDLNSIQAAINAIIGKSGTVNGMYSMYAVTVDGTGGSVVASPTAGTVKVSLSATSTATPNATTVPIATICRESIPCASGIIIVGSGAATISRGFNISSVMYNSAGYTTVTTLVSAPNELIAVCTPFSFSGFWAPVYVMSAGITANTFDVKTYNSSASSNDESYSFVCYPL